MTIPPDELKRAIKDALAETLAERPDWLREVLAEAIEELGMTAAIREGLSSPVVRREELDLILRGDA